MAAKKAATKKAKTLLIGKIVPTPPAPPRPPKSDTDRLVDALGEIESTLSYRLEMIEDNVNALSTAISYASDAVERAIRGEARSED